MSSDKKIFAVIAGTQPEQLQPKIEAEFPENLTIGVGQWLVIGPSTMTTQELSLKLGLNQAPTPENNSSAIVLSVNSYFGRAPLSIWEWLTAKMGDASVVAR